MLICHWLHPLARSPNFDYINLYQNRFLPQQGLQGSQGHVACVISINMSMHQFVFSRRPFSLWKFRTVIHTWLLKNNKPGGFMIILSLTSRNIFFHRRKELRLYGSFCNIKLFLIICSSTLEIWFLLDNKLSIFFPKMVTNSRVIFSESGLLNADGETA